MILHTRYRCEVMPQTYDEKEIVPLTVARTGSDTLTEVLKAAGMQHAHHAHGCTLADAAEHKAKRVIITLRAPLSRIISGYKRQREEVSSELREKFRQSFASLNQYLDALRVNTDSKHKDALEFTWIYMHPKFWLP